MSLPDFLFQPYLAASINSAITSGVPVQYFAYLLILPFLASVIAASRHLFGLATYGTFLPIVLALVWVELGLGWGAILTVFLLLWSWLSSFVSKKILVGRFRIHYLPRMSILLMLIGLGVLFLGVLPGWMIFTTQEGIVFPLLILVVMTQNMVEAQISLSKKESRAMLWQTVIFSLMGYLLFSWRFLAEFVIAFPGLTLGLVFLLNVLVGRYVGFRFLEYRKFQAIHKNSSGSK